MILHLVSDEKFVDNLINSFETVLPNLNDYILLTRKFNQFKYIRNTNRITIVLENTIDYKNLISELANYKAIFAHGLHTPNAKIINLAPKETLIFGIFLGADIFDRLPKYRNNNFFPLTNKVFNPISNYDKLIATGQLIYRFIKNVESDYKIRKKAFYRLDYVESLLSSKKDFLLNHNIVRKKVIFFKFTYYPLNMIVGSLPPITDGSKNILIGNSSSPSNNHLEAFKILSNFDLSDRKIIVPLNYGDERYREKLIPLGKELLNNNFEPITEFLTISDYNNLLSSCSIAIMNHRRPQALGNIIALLWLGVKIYMNSGNFIYDGLKRNGIDIYEIQSLKINNTSALNGLHNSQIQANRIVLKSMLGENVISGYIQNIKKIVFKN